MADNKRVEGRTTFIEENMKDGILKDIAMKVSKMGDAVGFTQEDKYKGKTREEIAKKPVPDKKSIDYGAKTPSGQYAAEKAHKEYGKDKKNWPLNAKKDLKNSLQAMDEADAEVKRETRGMKKGGMVGSASKRADGCAVRGKTKGRIV